MRTRLPMNLFLKNRSLRKGKVIKLSKLPQLYPILNTFNFLQNYSIFLFEYFLSKVKLNKPELPEKSLFQILLL